MEKNVFIVMPAYNAGATIEQVFSRIPEEVKGRIARYVVVNDGSTDDTDLALERIKRTGFHRRPLLQFALHCPWSPCPVASVRSQSGRPAARDATRRWYGPRGSVAVNGATVRNWVDLEGQRRRAIHRVRELLSSVC